LLNIRQLGRERLCEAKLEKLNEVHEWVGQYHKLWTGRMQMLKNFIEQESLHSNITVTSVKRAKKNIDNFKKK